MYKIDELKSELRGGAWTRTHNGSTYVLYNIWVYYYYFNPGLDPKAHIDVKNVSPP